MNKEVPFLLLDCLFSTSLAVNRFMGRCFLKVLSKLARKSQSGQEITIKKGEIKEEKGEEETIYCSYY